MHSPFLLPYIYRFIPSFLPSFPPSFLPQILSPSLALLVSWHFHPSHFPLPPPSLPYIHTHKRTHAYTHTHTQGNLKDLKHDLNVLKQISDLRVATVTKDKKYQYALHGNAERREARKELRKLAKAELNHDETIEKKMRDEEQAEMKELMKLKISDTAQPSLLVAARFLLDSYVDKLPIEKCQNCQKTVLPEIPENDAAAKVQGFSGKEHSLKPMRTYCGHWLHFKCLNDWLTSPPFIRYSLSPSYPPSLLPSLLPSFLPLPPSLPPSLLPSHSSPFP